MKEHSSTLQAKFESLFSCDGFRLTDGERTSEFLSLFLLFTLFQCLCKIGHKSPVISELPHKSVLLSASVGSCYRKVKNGKGRRKMKSVKPHHISLLQQCSHAAYKLSIPSYFSLSIKMIMPVFYSGEKGCLKLCRAPAAVPRALAQVLIELLVLLVLNHGKVNWKAVKYLVDLSPARTLFSLSWPSSNTTPGFAARSNFEVV